MKTVFKGDGVHDLVVVGAGLAGMTAAVRAAELGLRVLVLEAGVGESYPCNSRMTMGFFHIAFNDVTAEPSHLRHVISEVTHHEADPALAECMATRIGPSVQWLSAHGGRFMKGGPFAWMSRVLAPPRVRRTGVHWKGRGGDVLLRKLAQRLESMGGTLLTGVRARSLEMKGGHCVGLFVQNGSESLCIDARAVILADGGFQANADMVRKFISPRPEKLCMRNAGSGQGDGLSMAIKAGAATHGLHRFYGHVQCLEAIGTQELWPYPVLDHLGSAGLIVDSEACRFADEGHGGIFMANAIAGLPEPDSAVVIFDEAIWNGIGRESMLAPNPGAISAGAHLFTSESIAGLAQQLGLPAAKLAETVAAHNRFTSGDETVLHPPRTTGAMAPQPIQCAPYHAFRACAGVTYTMGGILIDEKARVLDTAGTPIPGLYAAGAATGGLEGGGAAGYVGGLSKALVFGLIAAESAAAINSNSSNHAASRQAGPEGQPKGKS